MKRYTLWVLAMGWVLSVASGAGTSPSRSLNDGWDAYKSGDLEKAEKLVQEKADTDEGRHLLAMLHHFKGRYQKSIAAVKELPEDFVKGNKTLVEATGWSYMYLGQYEEGAKFLEKNGASGLALIANKQMAKKPLKVELNEVAVVGMQTRNRLNSMFPAFPAKVNEQSVTAHMDTGGNWVMMHPSRAKKMGIELVEAGTGSAIGRAKLSFGVADSFSLGDAPWDRSRKAARLRFRVFSGQMDSRMVRLIRSLTIEHHEVEHGEKENSLGDKSILLGGSIDGNCSPGRRRRQFTRLDWNSIRL